MAAAVLGPCVGGRDRTRRQANDQSMSIRRSSKRTVCKNRRKPLHLFARPRLHPLFATVAATGDVVHSRLRGGPANSARGAAGSSPKRSDGSGRRSDRTTVRPRRFGSYNQSVVACTNAGVTFSITAKMTKKLRALIEGIDAAEWAPIRIP